MHLSFHEEKRALTLANRGLDFADAEQVFSGPLIEVEDDRRDYGEVRYQTIGRLNGEIVMVVWTPRSDARHIISMRKCSDKERQNYQRHVGGP